MNNELTIKERLNLFREFKKISFEEMAKCCQVSVSFFTRENVNPSSTSLIKIAKAYPELNILWVIGIGDYSMLNDTTGKSTNEYKEENERLKIYIIKLEGQIEILQKLLVQKKNK